MANGEWQHYLGYEDIGYPGAMSFEVEELEDELDVVFPDDYREALFDHQGAAPAAQVLEISPRRRTPVGCLLHIGGARPEDQAYGVSFQLERLRESGYERLVPIFRTGTGWVCLDYRECRERPPVVFVNSDLEADAPGAVTVVARSFSELLAKLV